MTKFIKKTPEQIERHRIIRKQRRHNDTAYRERINLQSNERYKKKRLSVLLKDLKQSGIKVNTENFEVVLEKWKAWRKELSDIQRTDRYKKSLVALKERYNTDEEYRNRQLKKADRQYDERKEFVGTIVNENERLKRKIKEIENGTR